MNQHPDQLIDQVLHALRDTQPPDGLETRIAARLAKSAENRSPDVSPLAMTGYSAATSFFAVILNAVKDPRILFAEPQPYAWATLVIILAVAVASSTFLIHRHDQTTAQWNPTSTIPYSQTSTSPNEIANSDAVTTQPSTIPSETNEVHRHLSLATHPTETAAAPTPDLDAIALAETQAPSRAAPPMPLTAQERLLILATRQGQPIEVAELDMARGTALRSIAQAREHAALRNYVEGLLAPLAAAQALTPTSPTSDEAPPVTASDPPTSK